MSKARSRSGLLVVISAPSGGGKTTILGRLLELGLGECRYSVSVTTRKRRPGEADGQAYHFVSLADFERMRATGEFVEWAEVHGNYYATPRSHITRWLEQGYLVLSDLDVKGGLAVKQHFGDQALLIFVSPPSLESLVDRLSARGTETKAEIEKRLSRYPPEMEMAKKYDYHCVNDDLEQTITRIIEIINQHYSLS